MANKSTKNNVRKATSKTKSSAKPRKSQPAMVTAVNPMPKYQRQVDEVGKLVDVSGNGSVFRFSPRFEPGKPVQRYQIQKDGNGWDLYKFSLSSRKLRFVESVTSPKSAMLAIKKGKYENVFGTYGQ